MEIPMPKWELTDPFGRAAIKGLRYELKRAACERDGYRAQVEEILKEQGKAVMMLARSLEHEQAVTLELTRRLKVCDEARKNLGDQLRKANAAVADLQKQVRELTGINEELHHDHEELLVEHDKLVRGLTDKEVAV